MSFLSENLVADFGSLAGGSEAVRNIGSTVDAANSAAAQATTNVTAAAGDEVSAAIASLFSGHGQEFQATGATAATAGLRSQPMWPLPPRVRAGHRARVAPAVFPG